MIEVSVSTLRHMLINRGERLIGSILAFFEVSLWLIVTGTVLAGFSSDWIKIGIFALAFALGNYLGSWLEGKLAFGISSIQVIVPENINHEGLVDKLRENDFGVTVLGGEGKEGERKILILHLRRRRTSEAVHIVKKYSKDVFITTSSVNLVFGGHITKK
jgi:uncharacterized protein YebE (UPF0316 family)